MSKHQQHKLVSRAMRGMPLAARQQAHKAADAHSRGKAVVGQAMLASRALAQKGVHTYYFCTEERDWQEQPD